MKVESRRWHPNMGGKGIVYSQLSSRSRQCFGCMPVFALNDIDRHIIRCGAAVYRQYPYCGGTTVGTTDSTSIMSRFHSKKRSKLHRNRSLRVLASAIPPTAYNSTAVQVYGSTAVLSYPTFAALDRILLLLLLAHAQSNFWVDWWQMKLEMATNSKCHNPQAIPESQSYTSSVPNCTKNTNHTPLLEAHGNGTITASDSCR